MKNLPEKIRIFREERKYKSVLKYRTLLSEHEKNFLIPQIKLRLEYLKDLLLKIRQFFEDAKNNTIFKQTLYQIINPLNLELVKTPSQITEEFCNKVIKAIDEEYLKDLNELIEFKTIKNFAQLESFLNQGGLFLTSTIDVDNKLVLMNLQSYLVLVNLDDQSSITRPQSDYIIPLPIKNSFNTIINICKSSLENIQIWNKNFLKEKDSFLNRDAHKINLKHSRTALFIQIVAIILGIILSFMFISGEDAFGILKKNSTLNSLNRSITSELKTIKTKNVELGKQIKNLESIVSNQNKSSENSK